MNVQNELGVVVVFAQACQDRGWKIDHIQSEFPDAIIQDSDGKTYRAEFEFCASNFKAHQHDLFGCDVIICWENDWNDCPLTVWDMQNWSDPAIEIMDKKDIMIAALTIENERLKRQLSKAENEVRSQNKVSTLAGAYTGLKAAQRREKLIVVYGDNPTAKSDELAPLFGVSPSTIRRDLGILTETGELGNNGRKMPVKVEEAG